MSDTKRALLSLRLRIDQGGEDAVDAGREAIRMAAALAEADDATIEAMARIIDPDAWEPDGVYLYRQDRARGLARASLTAAMRQIANGGK